MSGVRVRYSVDHVHIGLDIGGLRFISTHRGMDRIEYVDVRFEHGLLQMTSDQLRTLVCRGQEALASRNEHIGEVSGS